MRLSPRTPARLVGLVLFLLALFLLTPGFYKNQWQVAGKKWFPAWRANSDFRIVARLVQSRQSGSFSYGGLSGVGDTTWPFPPGIVDHQYTAYLTNARFDTFLTYNSVLDFQGVLFAWFDQLTDFSPGYTLKILQGATALLTALFFAGLILWFFAEFGWLSALLILASLVCSQWVTLFGGSLYWQLWAFYLPFLGTAYWLRQAQTPSANGLAWLVAATLLIKILFNGFEYITTTLIMAFVPVVYYAVLNKWTMKLFYRHALHFSLASLAGVFSGLTILFLQLTAVLGEPRSALATILYNLAKRSFGNVNEFPVEAESLRASLFSVLQTYVTGGEPIRLGLLKTSPFESVQYSHFIFLFAVFSGMALLLRRSKNDLLSKKILALLITTWFSLAAPLSWLVLFKAHSYIHTQLNYIIWQMPFTLFGFSLCGFVLSYGVKRFLEKITILRVS